MIAVLLVLLLIVPYTVLYKLDRSLRGRINLAILLCFMGTAHFFKTQEMMLLLPEWALHREALIHAAGVMELAAATGLLIHRFARLTGICLILFLVCVFPANIYGMIHRVKVGGHEAGLAYLWIRLPLQLLLIGWTYYFTPRSQD